MKNNYLYNWVVIVFMMLQMLAFTSCSDDDVILKEELNQYQ